MTTDNYPSIEDRAKKWCKCCHKPTVARYSEIHNKCMSLCCEAETWKDYDHMMLDRLEKAQEDLRKLSLDGNLPSPTNMGAIEDAIFQAETA